MFESRPSVSLNMFMTDPKYIPNTDEKIEIDAIQE